MNILKCQFLHFKINQIFLLCECESSLTSKVKTYRNLNKKLNS